MSTDDACVKQWCGLYVPMAPLLHVRSPFLPCVNDVQAIDDGERSCELALRSRAHLPFPCSAMSCACTSCDTGLCCRYSIVNSPFPCVMDLRSVEYPNMLFKGTWTRK